MTQLQKALPCPFCGKQHTLQVISGQELMGEDQEFWQHSESFGVVCDASTPDGKGGCGAMGGFKPTEDEAIEAWNTRTALAQHGEKQPVCHGCGIPAGGLHMSTCKSGKWPSRVSNGDTAAPAPQQDGTFINEGTKSAPKSAQGEPTGCACRWDADDNRVATCERHQGWLDVVSEWAERAKAAEKARGE